MESLYSKWGRQIENTRKYMRGRQIIDFGEWCKANRVLCCWVLEVGGILTGGRRSRGMGQHQTGYSFIWKNRSCQLSEELGNNAVCRTNSRCRRKPDDMLKDLKHRWGWRGWTAPFFFLVQDYVVKDINTTGFPFFLIVMISHDKLSTCFPGLSGIKRST